MMSAVRTLGICLMHVVEGSKDARSRRDVPSDRLRGYMEALGDVQLLTRGYPPADPYGVWGQHGDAARKAVIEEMSVARDNGSI